VLTALMALLLAGCIRIIPILKSEDRLEAIALARVLHNLAPTAKDLMTDELLCANQLKVLLDEAARKPYTEYQVRFETLIDQLVVVREKRQQLQLKVNQATWQGILPRLYQKNASDELQEELSRVVSWIQLAHNFKLRAEVGRTTGFPEFMELAQSLDLFLGESVDEPFSLQLTELKTEYHFQDSDL
jgi:hypothetical protein